MRQAIEFTAFVKKRFLLQKTASSKLVHSLMWNCRIDRQSEKNNKISKSKSTKCWNNNLHKKNTKNYKKRRFLNYKNTIFSPNNNVVYFYKLIRITFEHILKNCIELYDAQRKILVASKFVNNMLSAIIFGFIITTTAQVFWFSIMLISILLLINEDFNEYFQEQ